MKIAFVHFATAFTLIMAAYVSFRGWQVLQSFQGLRITYLVANIVLFLLMMLGLMSQGSLSPIVSKTITFIGYSYMIVLIYLLLSFALVDIVRLLNLLFGFAGLGMKTFRMLFFFATIVVISVAMIYGNYKFNHPTIVELDIAVANPTQNKTIRIVAVSDIHLGVSIEKTQLKKYVDLINAQNPDLVLMAGDVTDNIVSPLIEQNMAEELRQIKSTHGVYAVSGNHEYYSEHPLSTERYLQTAGIVTLRDNSALIDQSFYIVGRDDRANQKRAELSQIVSKLDSNKPKILLDHQPYHLVEAQENGIDLQFSGHTHNGQFFPGNLFVKRMYELAHGYMKRGKTHYYISSGLGLWGPQYRIGTQSEIVLINFKY
jgi:predicted MPP superfamily phosphohydrolase